ncbi:DEIH-box ATPase [Ceratobasidium sp. 428]|nr:DEIH-box ATPase [Ceratobasidium sp. 428]
MLTIHNESLEVRDEETGAFDLDSFKIVYIAPMKALVQDMVSSFSKRLQPYGVKIGELTGDSQLTKQQIPKTQIIVTTPDKRDVITRKSIDTSFNLVHLVVIVSDGRLLDLKPSPSLSTLLACSYLGLELRLIEPSIGESPYGLHLARLFVDTF